MLIIVACKSSDSASLKRFSPASGFVVMHGRTLTAPDSSIVLIGSASFIEYRFSGTASAVWLKNIADGDDYNYVAAELDDQYIGRWKITGDSAVRFPLKASSSQEHTVRIFKATEAANGQVVVTGIEAHALLSLPAATHKKIEFIGNSITCGMANDTKDIPCGKGRWYDQHNAYWAYGPRVARALQTDFMLSSVSGIGIYRNWNSDGPVMPQVYESAFLSVDSSVKWHFDRYVPDVVSIALGTNDFSDGDGIKERLPFDSAAFIEQYVRFIGRLYSLYPHSQFVLLNSPMVPGSKGVLLDTCLNSIAAQIALAFPARKPVAVFHFKPMSPKGCSSHPDIDDHAIMANELIPFFRMLLQGSDSK